MDTDRRNLLKTITAASAMMAVLPGAAEAAIPAGTAPAAKAVTSAPGSPVAPLIAAGLDPLTVYRKIFATADKEGCYWLYTGPFSADVADDVGSIYFMQEETLSATQTEDAGPDAFYMDQRAAGIFRDIKTGNVITTSYDPRTGESANHHGAFMFSPSRTKISKSGSGLAFDTVYHTAVTQSVTVGAGVEGGRVSLAMYSNYNLSATSKLGQVAILKFYASLADLKSGMDYVPAQGFYCTRDRETGKILVSGDLQKARVGEKLNPLAWDRVKAAYPDFFDGDRVSMNWKYPQ